MKQIPDFLQQSATTFLHCTIKHTQQKNPSFFKFLIISLMANNNTHNYWHQSLVNYNKYITNKISEERCHDVSRVSFWIFCNVYSIWYIFNLCSYFWLSFVNTLVYIHLFKTLIPPFLCCIIVTFYSKVISFQCPLCFYPPLVPCIIIFLFISTPPTPPNSYFFSIENWQFVLLRKNIFWSCMMRKKILKNTSQSWTIVFSSNLCLIRMKRKIWFGGKKWFEIWIAKDLIKIQQQIVWQNLDQRLFKKFKSFWISNSFLLIYNSKLKPCKDKIQIYHVYL